MRGPDRAIRGLSHRWAFWPKAYGGQGAIEHQRGLLNRKLAWCIVWIFFVPALGVLVSELLSDTTSPPHVQPQTMRAAPNFTPSTI